MLSVKMVSIGMGMSLFPELYDDLALLEIDGWEERRNVGLYWRESSGRQRHYIALAEAAAVAASSLGIET